MPVDCFGKGLFTRILAAVFLATIGVANAIAEQAGGTNPPEETIYQTKGISFDQRLMSYAAKASYWEQKVAGVLKLVVDPRLQDDADERDAVLATIWQVKPEPISAETRILAIIKRPAKPQKNIAYQVTFFPRPSAQEKDRVEARFISEGAGRQSRGDVGAGRGNPEVAVYLFDCGISQQ